MSAKSRARFSSMCSAWLEGKPKYKAPVQTAVSRAVILDMFSLDLPLPVDTSKDVGCFYTERRSPLLLLPLSADERKVLSSLSINSEKRTYTPRVRQVGQTKQPTPKRKQR